MPHSAPTSSSLLADSCSQAQVALSSEQQRLFWALDQFLQGPNAKLKLTRQPSSASTTQDYLEGALLPRLLQLPASLMVLGIETGMLGLALKIMRPDINIILADPCQDSLAFWQESIDRLQLKGIKVQSGSPDIARQPALTGVLARPVAQGFSARTAYLKECLAAGGQAIFLLAPQSRPALQAVFSDQPAYRLVRQKSYVLPMGAEGLLMVYERQAEARPPRRPAAITSAANTTFKKLMALHTAKGIRLQAKFLTGGPKILRELRTEQSGRILDWISTADMPPPPAELQNYRWIVLAQQQFQRLNLMGLPGPLVTLSQPTLQTFDPQAPWPEGCTLFIPFGDPENVGSVIRAAAGLGAARVVLLQEAACPFLPKAVRASAGAVWKIRIETGPALPALPDTGAIPLLALDARGEPLERIKRPPRHYGLVVGMEGLGLPEIIRRRARLISIPLVNRIESLNAAMATAILLWAWRP